MLVFWLLLFCLFPLQGYADENASIDCSAASYTLPQGQWHLISLPCNPGNNNSVGAIVADDMPGAIGTDWTIYEYDAQSLAYRELIEEDVLTQGRGYWVIQISDNETIINLEGSADTGVATIPLATRPGKYQWNMIGLPLSEERPLSESRIITQTGQCASGCSLDEAMDQKVVDKIWRYNSVSEEYDFVPSTENAYPWSGYFIATLSSADGTNPSLIFPVNLDKKVHYSLGSQHPSGYIGSSNNLITLRAFSAEDEGVKVLKNCIIGSFTDQPDKYHMYYSSENKPANGYDRYAYYAGTEYDGFSERWMYASHDKNTLLGAIGSGSCWKWASNYSGGNLNRNNNFWTYFCPNQGLVDYVRDAFDKGESLSDPTGISCD